MKDTVKINKGNVQLVAHRGLSGIETENTASAFVAAGNRSYFGIEADVYKTADNRFAISHDKSLERVSGERISVEGSTLSELQQIILYGKDGKKTRTDLRVPTLCDYIGICKSYGKHAFLELKSDFTKEEIKNIIGIIRELDYLDVVTFISFGFDNLVKVREIEPRQSVQYLFDRVSESVMKITADHSFDVDVNYRSLTRENIEAFHKAGQKVNCWTVDDRETAHRLIEWGVDQITTNILE